MSDTSTNDLATIAQAKARLAEELRKLEEQEVQLRQHETGEAFSEVVRLLNAYAGHFTAKQRAEIAALAGAGEDKPARTAGKDKAKREVPPKYWLPHSGETWTGRGRTPKAFAAWEGTAAYNEWKARHPNEKFPPFPG